jgi:hypothetical protein
MRTRFSSSRHRSLRTLAGVAGYAALVTLIITVFTTSGFVAAVTAALTIGLLVGGYLLERWARRRVVHSPGPGARDDADESRMAKV